MAVSPLRCALLSSALVVAEACTSIAVGRAATVDDSTLVTQTDDCAECDSRIVHIPARDHAPGSMRPILPYAASFPREVSDRSPQYSESDGRPATEPLGYIPQVLHTFAYWETTNPIMNEHGVGFGETTIDRTRLSAFQPNTTNFFYTHEAMKVALERCKTARCALRTMGDLVDRYGFYGDSPFSGESVSVIDPDEAWVFQVTVGARGKSAAWAAQRIPDGHVAVVANGATIRHIDVHDEDNFMVGANLFSAALEEGLWDGKEAFDFARMMQPDTMEVVPRYTSMRMWRIYSRLAPSLDIQPHVDPLAMPFSVRVEVPVSHRTLMDMHRDHYEGTEFDMRNGALAGPFRDPNRLEGGRGQRAVRGEIPRAISIPRTSYAVVVQSRPKKLAAKLGSAGVAWYASDAPATSVFVPFYANSSWGHEEPSDYGRGSMFKFDRKCAWWAFDFVANWMELDYENMSQVVVPAVKKAQDSLDASVARIEAKAGHLVSQGKREEALQVLSDWQTSAQQDVVDKWWQLADYLVVRFNDGFDNQCIDAGGPPRDVDKGQPSCKVGVPIGYPAWFLEEVGYGFDIRPHFVKPAGRTPPSMFSMGAQIDGPEGAPWMELLSPPVVVDTYWQGTKVRGQAGATQIAAATQAPQADLSAQLSAVGSGPALPQCLGVLAGVFVAVAGMVTSYLAGLRQGRREHLPDYYCYIQQ
mmetsp:Transcript_5281/g.13028  ORF Transcript_5281/g.13028 Transcript_5281/m.13028 type:complete len:698 (+) Transcript_5281:58-2151(+)